MAACSRLACFLALPSFAACGPSHRAEVILSLHPEAALPARARFCPKEYLKWSLRWKGIEAATTEMVVGEPGSVDGQPAIIVYSLSKSSEIAAIFLEVREELTSKISLASGRPSENDSETVEDKESELLEVRFADAGASYSVDLRGSVPHKSWSLNEGDSTTDVHGFMGQLRVWDGLPAEGAVALVQNGRSHFRVEMAVRGRESIRTFLGKTPAIRIDGIATRQYKDGKKIAEPELREFTVWRSDDERFLPLRFQVDTRLGLVQGTLEDYRPPDLSTCVNIEPR